MKKKILFALAMPAILAACSNEEIVDVQSSEMKEVVGAELVSKGMTINFGDGAESRMTAQGKFDNSDKLGLGWVVTNGAGTTQVENVEPNNEALYANHLFVKNGEADNAFTTYSNVYTGWHFAYYPYTRLSKIEQMKIANINPAMTKEYKYENGTKAEFMENRLHISAKDFIEPTDVDANNALVGKKFDLVPMVSTFTVAADVAADIKNEADLKTLKITKLELTAGKDIFYTGADLKPQYLPSAKYKDIDPSAKVELVYDDVETKKLMTVENLFGETEKAIKKTGKEATISTAINVESYKLDGLKELRMNILPVDEADLYATATTAGLVLKVYVEGGYFTVEWHDQKVVAGNKIPYTDTEITNNTAITKIANLLSVAGHKVDGVNVNWSDLIGNQGVKVALAKENFTPDYTGIKTIGQWNGCVKVANAYDKTIVPTFKLGDGAKIEFPAGTMNVPSKGVNVTRNAWGDSQIIFKGETTWNSNITGCDNGVTVVVEETGKLTVENALWASRIVNKGTILAGELSSIGAAGENRFDNAEGRVVVEYGAYVYPSVGQEGIIAYNVDGSESAAKINTLVATNGDQNGYAKVNTLIIENNVSLDLTKKDGNNVDNDRYHGSTSIGKELANMQNVTIEMNGGSILAAQGKVKDVYNVVVKGGDNFVTDVNLKGDLIIEAGNITIDATEYAVKVGKETQMVKDAVIAGNIVNKGKLTSNVDVYVFDIDNEEGTIIVTKPYTIWYSGDYAQGGSAQGRIMKYTVAPTPVEENADKYIITNASELVWFEQEVNKGNEFAGKTVELGANIDLAGIQWNPIGHIVTNLYDAVSFKGIFDGKGNTISNLTVITKDHAALFGVLADGASVQNLKIDGASITSFHFAAAIVANAWGSTINNCEVTNITVNCVKGLDSEGVEEDGNKAGTIVGVLNQLGSGSDATMTNCKASNSIVKAGRDAGQLVGAAKQATVTGCSATDVFVSANGMSTGANINNDIIGRVL